MVSVHPAPGNEQFVLLERGEGGRAIWFMHLQAREECTVAGERAVGVRWHETTIAERVSHGGMEGGVAGRVGNGPGPTTRWCFEVSGLHREGIELNPNEESTARKESDGRQRVLSRTDKVVVH